nr:hypothetical protein CFP56_57627 [Quercus suber]
MGHHMDHAMVAIQLDLLIPRRGACEKAGIGQSLSGEAERGLGSVTTLLPVLTDRRLYWLSVCRLYLGLQRSCGSRVKNHSRSRVGGHHDNDRGCSSASQGDLARMTEMVQVHEILDGMYLRAILFPDHYCSPPRLANDRPPTLLLPATARHTRSHVSMSRKCGQGDDRHHRRLVETVTCRSSVP